MLPLNDAVRCLTAGRAFIWNFVDDEPDDLIEALSQVKHDMFDRLPALGLRPRIVPLAD